MSAEAELAAAQARIAELEGAQRATVKSNAIAASLAGHDLVPGGAQQLTALLEPGVILAKGVDGKETAVAANTYAALDSHVSELLRKPEYSHFVKTKGAFPATAPTSPAPSHQVDLRKQPGESDTAHLVRYMQHQNPNPDADPRLDPSKPMAIGARALIRKH
jgi:hypothetical protein